jgi:protein TonB
MKRYRYLRTALTFTLFLAILFGINQKLNARKMYPTDDEYAVVVDKSPTPVGGVESIVRKIVYPQMAISTRTEGKVYLLIYINESGNVDDVKVIKGIGAGCDEESIRVIKKTKFTAGEQKGVPVKTTLSLALAFKLPS